MRALVRSSGSDCGKSVCNSGSVNRFFHVRSMRLKNTKSAINLPDPMNEAMEHPPRDAPAEHGRNEGYYTSYSANYEDVILHRIFGQTATGFYVDVGAAHPTYENDTKLLYDAGWSGVNVEPNPEFFKLLESERVRDRNYCLALSNEAGHITYYKVVDTGLSTCDKKLADRARDNGYEVVPQQIPATTLAIILDDIQPQSFDLLKVDVEGFEEQVLSGNDWKMHRPSVIIVEATYPETPKRRPTNIRAQLESEDYVWRYFDGLNDFYIDKNFELSDDVFDRPPNIFDRFKLRALVELESEFTKSLEHASSLEKEVAKAHRHAQVVEAQLADEAFERRRLAHATNQMRQDILAYSQELETAHRNREELLHVKSKLRAVIESRSWTLTRPYREIERILKRLFGLH